MDMSNASVASRPMPVAPTGATPTTPEPVVEQQVPQQAPAQEQAPVAPEAPAVPVVEQAPAPESLDLTEPVVTADQTGNATLDSVAKVLADKGLGGASSIFKEVAETGEVSFSDHAKIVEALGESLGGMLINQVKAEVNNIKTQKQAQSQKVLDYAAQKFGADPAQANQAWTEIQQFVRTPESGFSAEDRKAMTQMLNNGGLQAEMVLDRIHSAYQTSGGYTQQADLITGDNAVGSTFTPLTKTEYTEKLRDVVNKYGYDSHQAAQLRQQRVASMQRNF